MQAGLGKKVLCILKDGSGSNLRIGHGHQQSLEGHGMKTAGLDFVL